MTVDRVDDMRLSPRSIKVGKCVVSVIWLLIVVASVSPSQLSFPDLFYGLAVFFVISHAYLMIKHRKILRGLGDILGVFLFGLLHLWVLKV